LFKRIRKRKEKKIKYVVGGETMKNDVKTKEKWFGKQNKDGTKVN